MQNTNVILTRQAMIVPISTKFIAVLALTLSCMLACDSRTSKEEALQWLNNQEARPIQPFMVPTISDIPAGQKGDSIRKAIDILTRTSEFMGKNAPNPQKRFSHNNLNCTNCHKAGPSGLPGTEPYSMPWVNVLNDYPKFDPKSMKMINLEERVIGMFGKGKVQLTADTEEVKLVMTYLKWLNEKAKPGHTMSGTGLKHISLKKAADPQAGKKLYNEKCQSCHGSQGLGIKHPDFLKGKGYIYPPVAGEDSYDDGGHVYMIPTLASIIYVNMPLGLATPENPSLSIEEAYDIAAYINHDLERRHHPNRKTMYPEALFRPDAFVIPEMFDNDQERYLKAKFGPYKKPYGLE